jgi:hypothetical protein
VARSTFHPSDLALLRWRVKDHRMSKRLTVPASLSTWANDALCAVAGRPLCNEVVRRWAVGLASGRRRAGLSSAPQLRSAGRRVGRERRLVALSVLHTVDRLVEPGSLAPEGARVISKVWDRALYSAFSSKRPPVVRRFRDEHGAIHRGSLPSALSMPATCTAAVLCQLGVELPHPHGSLCAAVAGLGPGGASQASAQPHSAWARAPSRRPQCQTNGQRSGL